MTMVAGFVRTVKGKLLTARTPAMVSYGVRGRKARILRRCSIILRPVRCSVSRTRECGERRVGFFRCTTPMLGTNDRGKARLFCLFSWESSPPGARQASSERSSEVKSGPRPTVIFRVSWSFLYRTIQMRSSTSGYACRVLVVRRITLTLLFSSWI